MIFCFMVLLVSLRNKSFNVATSEKVWLAQQYIFRIVGDPTHLVPMGHWHVGVLSS